MPLNATISAVDRLTNESVELLQQLIRNECVNDGRVDSGNEIKSARTIRDVLEGSGLDIELREPKAGRGSVIARIEGRDSTAPSLCLMGHTDVVPVTESEWRHPPFGGDLIDGEIWGRGAIDMLNVTAAMAIVVRQLALEGFRPRGNLIFVGVADEEAGGLHGASWLCNNEWEAVGADHMITEGGGIAVAGRAGRRVTVSVAEKGASWRRLIITGEPGHGSQPFGVNNALVKAAEVVRRLADYRPTPEISGLWREFVAASDWPDDLQSALTDPASLDDALEILADRDPADAKLAHACTHTTFSPNVIHGGVKANVIPETIILEVDVRTLPGQTTDEATTHVRRALGDLADDVHISPVTSPWEATSSGADSRLFETIGHVVSTLLPGTAPLGALLVGGTDARYFRAKGATAYGFGLFAENVKYSDIASRFHGINERVDLRSMYLATQALLEIARLFLD